MILEEEIEDGSEASWQPTKIKLKNKSDLNVVFINSLSRFVP
jgi:hypothetical protein